MKTDVRDTSRQAYAELNATGVTSAKQIEILNVMAYGRDYSLSELGKMTGMEKSSVSGRVHELKEMGKVVESRKRACKVTGKTITAVKKATQ